MILPGLKFTTIQSGVRCCTTELSPFIVYFTALIFANFAPKNNQKISLHAIPAERILPETGVPQPCSHSSGNQVGIVASSVTHQMSKAQLPRLSHQQQHSVPHLNHFSTTTKRRGNSRVRQAGFHHFKM